MDFCYVTTTFSETLEDMRCQLALRMARNAQKHGYPLIVVDGSPDPRIKEVLAGYGAIVYPQEARGMWPSRKQTIQTGLDLGYKYVNWLEPEKDCVATPKITDPCMAPLRSGECDMVIMWRESLDTYPEYQAVVEREANWLATSIIGLPLDLWSGPRFMTREAAKEIAKYNGEHGNQWEGIFVPVVRMMKRGFRIKSVVVKYVHPPEQRIEDDEKMRQKRRDQRDLLLAAMRAEADEIGYKPKLVWP